MADFLINSLRGGLNEDPPSSIADDQCTVATNVEWVRSALGERRLGADGIDLTGSGIESYSRITWAFRHEPTIDPREAQLWLLAVLDSPETVKLVYKDSSGWHTVVPQDAIDPLYVYQVVGQSLHGKLFLAYKSDVDRLHVWDGTSLRRTGLAEPAAPSVVDAGSGFYTGTRYFRVRYVAVDPLTGVVTRRSEPSNTTTFTPSGTGSAARLTKPAAISEGETHWEVEGSLDASNFYRIARVAVATTTYDDTTVFAAGYINASGAVLSEDVGDYGLIPSVRYLTADQDRLVPAGSFEDGDLSSRVMWTPVFGDVTGAGNDERIPVDTVNFLDLDTKEGGEITGISAAASGYVYVTKYSHTYQLVRSGQRTRSYESITLTKTRGAIEGSLVTALDNTGNPVLFMLDPDVGPCMFNKRGVEQCGLDLIETWTTVNLDAAYVQARGVYFPENKQVHWWVPTGDSDTPDTRLVLHTKAMRETPEGTRGGWVKWDGLSAAALTACLFAVNVDDMDEGASKVLVPFIGVVGDGLVWQTNIGDDDNGTDYAARIVTKPYTHGDMLNQFESKSGVVLAKAEADAALAITIYADFGLVTKTVDDIDLSPKSEEAWVIRPIDNLSLSEIRALQIEFADVESPQARWQLERFGLRETGGQRA